MALQGSITELQDTLAKSYLKLEQRFRENQLIRDLWTAMAHDVTQQKRSMSVLSGSFWNKLKNEQTGLSEAVMDIRRHHSENKEDHSLKSCFEQALRAEEPTILRLYVPIIRKLRENWTDQALDFYIMVKAHLARIERVTHSFAGDPVIIQRSTLLLQTFEKEVQEPLVVPEIRHPKARPIKQQAEKHAAKHQKKPEPKKAPALAKRVKPSHKRTKPLVKKLSLPRRRARR